ncbi:hypothetical protein C8R47DRAFT_1296097 [Mycena vitilis]|nr:hypothetical protein C8R47DRAFT_1296097 [Mycena vitilis]
MMKKITDKAVVQQKRYESVRYMPNPGRTKDGANATCKGSREPVSVGIVDEHGEKRVEVKFCLAIQADAGEKELPVSGLASERDPDYMYLEEALVTGGKKADHTTDQAQTRCHWRRWVRDGWRRAGCRVGAWRSLEHSAWWKTTVASRPSRWWAGIQMRGRQRRFPCSAEEMVSNRRGANTLVDGAELRWALEESWTELMVEEDCHVGAVEVGTHSKALATEEV